MHRSGGGGLTDFIVSKVAMSVCALLVAASLTEAVGPSLSPSLEDDLEEVLSDLQSAVSSAAALGGECSIEWNVPSLPSGDAVRLRISGCSATACAEGAARATEIRPELHTWTWDGAPMNRTELESLDLSAVCLEARSGDELTIAALRVPVDDSLELLLFVR